MQGVVDVGDVDELLAVGAVTEDDEMKEEEKRACDEMTKR